MPHEFFPRISKLSKNIHHLEFNKQIAPNQFQYLECFRRNTAYYLEFLNIQEALLYLCECCKPFNILVCKDERFGVTTPLYKKLVKLGLNSRAPVSKLMICPAELYRILLMVNRVTQSIPQNCDGIWYLMQSLLSVCLLQSFYHYNKIFTN